MKLKSLGIRLYLWLADLNSNHVIAPARYGSRREAIGYAVDNWLLRLFVACYVGSDEEIEDALSGETPPKYMSERQMEAVAEQVCRDNFGEAKIFPQPIGTLRDLGTAREWITEIACMAICAAVLLLAYIIL